MALTQEQFASLVKQLENQQNPGRYRQRVALLALLGYAYLVGVIAALILAIVLVTLLIVKFGVLDPRLFLLPLLLLVPLWIVVKSMLFVKMTAPEGLRLKRKQAPELFGLLDDLRRQLKAPKFHRVLVDRDFNAGVSQIPRLGLLGWHRNYLIIGLPLMQALSPEQFRAVLAHEMGHLSGNHARFSGWIYRVRRTWGQILDQFETQENEWLLWMFKPFLNWYVPFFNAYTFVLARADEYEADRCAAEMSGKKHCAEALVAIRVKSPQLHAFWDQVPSQTRHLVAPPAAYSELLATLRQPAAKNTSTSVLKDAFEQETDLADTHPCLRDRLTALGYRINRPEDLPMPDQVGITAAEQLLGETLTEITQKYDQEWQSEVSEKWQERHQYLKQRYDRLTELNHQDQQLTMNEQWEQAYLTLEVEGQPQSWPLMRDFLDAYPEHPAANYNVGMILLEQGDESGVEYLRNAMQRRYDWLADGCQLVYKFWYGQGDFEEAKTWEQYYRQESEKLALADHERTRISSRDRFLPHELTEAQIRDIRRQLRQYGDIDQVYIARKAVKQFPDDRLFVVALTLKPESRTQTIEEAVLNGFELDLGDFARQRILILNGPSMPRPELERTIAAVNGPVYQA